jgi:hypothetical protein
MKPYHLDGLTLAPLKEGSRQYLKASYPVRYGQYAEIQDRHYRYQFNLNGEIKIVQGQSHHWHHNDWLKRTAANDWIYYSASGYGSIESMLGEHYIPCLSYECSPYTAVNPFETEPAQKALAAVGNLHARIVDLAGRSGDEELRTFLRRAAVNDSAMLASRAQQLHAIIGSRVTVLPPDTRHADYDVIPVMIADGCLYKCGFCSFKTGRDFALRRRQDIARQLEKLRDFYGPDLRNYNSLFLGQHDALFAGWEHIGFTLETAYELFQLQDSFMNGANAFMFGSVGSLLAAPDSLFQSLNETPFYTYINIGLESAQQEALDILKKPLLEKRVREAFLKMMDINKNCDRIEITSNFVTGEPLPQGHVSAMIDLVKSSADMQCSKGAIYLSPLSPQKPLKAVREELFDLKRNSRIPVYLYIMQRL